MKILDKFILIIFALSILQVIALGQELKNIELTIESVPKITDLKKKNYQDFAPSLAFQFPLMMEINGKFSRLDHGTIVIGRILQGQVSVPDEVSLLGNRSTFTTIVTQAWSNKKNVESVKAGDDAALALRGVKLNQIKEGMILISPGSMQMHKAFRAEVTLKDDAGSSKPGSKPEFDIKSKSGFLQLHIHSANITTEYFLPNKDYWKAGKTVEAVFDLNYPVGLKQGMKFRLSTGGRLVGEGIVSSILF